MQVAVELVVARIDLVEQPLHAMQRSAHLRVERLIGRGLTRPLAQRDNVVGSGDPPETAELAGESAVHGKYVSPQSTQRAQRKI